MKHEQTPQNDNFSKVANNAMVTTEGKNQSAVKSQSTPYYKKQFTEKQSPSGASSQKTFSQRFMKTFTKRYGSKDSSEEKAKKGNSKYLKQCTEFAKRTRTLNGKEMEKLINGAN